MCEHEHRHDTHTTYTHVCFVPTQAGLIGALQRWTVIDSIYYAVMSSTSIGYGCVRAYLRACGFFYMCVRHTLTHTETHV